MIATDLHEYLLHAGMAFQWNIYSDVGTQGGRIDENEKMPETDFTITQGSGTIYEFGNSVPYSGHLDDASAHPVKQIIHKALKNDASKAFEIEAHAQFAATPLCVTSDQADGSDIVVTTNGTPGEVSAALANGHVKLISDEMKERNIPAFSDGNYRSIGRPSAYRAFKDDLESIHSYVDQGFQYILNGEVGRSYEGIRFFEQTGIATKGWTNTDEVFFFGDDTVSNGRLH